MFCKFAPCNIGKGEYFINIIKLVGIAATEKLSTQGVKCLSAAIKILCKTKPGF